MTDLKSKSIDLNYAATSLKIQKRRIYDIMHVLQRKEIYIYLFF